MKYRLHLKPLDFFFFALSIAACIAALFFIRQKNSGTPLLVVDSPSGEYVYPIDKNDELKVEGQIGISIIEIKNGKVWFADSPCPNKTCVQCRPISADGEWIACMPNQVFIRIESKTAGSVDIVAQ